MTKDHIIRIIIFLVGSSLLISGCVVFSQRINECDEGCIARKCGDPPFSFNCDCRPNCPNCRSKMCSFYKWEVDQNYPLAGVLLNTNIYITQKL